MYTIIALLNKMFSYFSADKLLHFFVSFCINNVLFVFFVLFFSQSIYLWQMSLISFFVTVALFGGGKEILDLKWEWPDMYANALGALLSNLMLILLTYSIIQ